MKTAIVYDRVNKWGGAERVLLSLHKLFPSAPLYTSVYNPETAIWAKVFPKVVPSFLQRMRFARTRHDLFAPLMPLAFESFDFSGFDLVISVTSESAKGIITQPKTLHVCYCLTPTRYLWSGYEEYFDNPVKRTITKPAVEYLKKWDYQASFRPDVLIGISQTVCNRIKKYYDRDSQLIYPPVDVRKFKFPSTNNEPSTTNYYLVVSRLVPYKKIDLVVGVFNSLNKRLVVIGDGSQRGRLEKKAKRNIEFKGQVTDEELRAYYHGAKAVIFPQEEDFGIVAVEAQAAGIPVIAFSGGGAAETVVEGTTGVFFNRQTKKALKGTLEKFERMKFDPKEISKHAKKFSEEKFLQQFGNLVKAELQLR